MDRKRSVQPVLVAVAVSIAANLFTNTVSLPLWLSVVLLLVTVALAIMVEVWPARTEPKAPAVPPPPPPEPKPEHVTPGPPEPDFVHPYPLQEHFTGRERERGMLTEWFTRDGPPVLALVAIGGMGKSALAWVWVNRDLPALPESSRPEGVLWWSFYEREARFSQFLDEALAYLSGGEIDPKGVPSQHDKVRAVVSCLRQGRFLLVLDGFERELRAYASLNAAYQGDEVAEGGDFCACTDPHAGDFLRSVAALRGRSRVLLTSRLLPRQLEGADGCRHEGLERLDPEDAVAFFRAHGIRKGTRAEIMAACEPYGYHPLALRLLAGMIVKDPAHPRDVRAAAGYTPIPDLKAREHNILALAYEALGKPQRELLSRIAAFRSPVGYEAVKAISPEKDERRLKAALQELVDRQLLLFDSERGRCDLHPVVRRHAYERLGGKAGVHTRLRDYFATVPPPDKVDALEDLNPVIELYHHTVRAGQYDEARKLFRDRLSDPLYFRFGAYQLNIELLRALFPDGEDRPPRLTQESAQAWTLNDLAASYSLSGQPRRAVPLVERQNGLQEKAGDKLNLAIGLGNLAYNQLALGQLRAAEANLRRKLEMNAGEFEAAVGHQELGRLLAFEGAFEEAARELEASTRQWERTGDKQGLCLDQAYLALRALLMGDAQAALEAAGQARQLADVERNERDIIRAEWLLGAALTGLGQLGEAEGHLTEALTRCRRINLIELEPDILLAWARWHRAKGEHDQALAHTQEALAIADRCEYRLKQADIHNFLARLALDAGDRATARRHAEIARERALCDGSPHCYKPALEEADRLLGGCDTIPQTCVDDFSVGPPEPAVARQSAGRGEAEAKMTGPQAAKEAGPRSWTTEQKVSIVLEYRRTGGACCPLDAAVLQVIDAGIHGDPYAILVECPICRNGFNSRELEPGVLQSAAERPYHVSPAIHQRLQQLAEHVKQDLQLLGEYEDALRYEDDPLRKAKYRRAIQQLRATLVSRQQEYDQLVPQLPGERPRQVQEIATQLAQIQGKLDVLAIGQVAIGQGLAHLQQTLLQRFDAGQRETVRAIIARLDEAQLAVTDAVLQAIEAGRLEHSELHEMLAAVGDTLDEVCERFRGVSDSALVGDVHRVAAVLKEPELDIAHKVKMSIPIIPFVLSYEWEAELKTGLNLGGAWQRLLAKVRGKP